MDRPPPLDTQAIADMLGGALRFTGSNHDVGRSTKAVILVYGPDADEVKEIHDGIVGALAAPEIEEQAGPN
jgi:hypothetical protein